MRTSFTNEPAKILIEKHGSEAWIWLRTNIEEVEIATPWTFSRYLNSPKGSAYGHEVSRWDNVIARTLNVEKDYTVEGLYPIGCDSTKGDGYSSAYMVGKEMADLALERMKNNEKNG